MKKILFAISQNADKSIENQILNIYREQTGLDFEFSSEYYLGGVKKVLEDVSYDILIIRENLERTKPMDIDFIDALTDHYPLMKVIIIISNEHKKDDYVKNIFNMGIYNVLYEDDLTLENIIKLIEVGRNKIEAKSYLGFADIQEISSDNILDDFPEELLEIVLNNLNNASAENISKIFDEINNQYTERQMLFLVSILSEEVSNLLIETKNKSFLSYIDRINAKLADEKDITESKKQKPISEKIPTNIVKNKFQIEFSERTITKEKIIGTIVISISGMQHGCGTTQTSLTIAKFLSEKGFVVGVVELKEKNDYALIYLPREKSYNNFSFRYKNNIDIYANDGEIDSNNLLISANSKRYDYMILDTGLLFEYDKPNGKLDKPSTQIKKFKQGNYYNEFMRADCKIVTMFPSTQFADSIEYFFNYINTWELGDLEILFNFISDQAIKNYKKQLNYNIYAIPYNSSDTLNEEQINFYSNLLNKILPKNETQHRASLGNRFKNFSNLLKRKREG